MMLAYHIKVKESVAEQVLSLLKGFSEEEVVIEKAEIQPIQDLNITCIEDLYGILSPYVNGYLSDEDIEDAIAQGAIESGMAGKNR